MNKEINLGHLLFAILPTIIIIIAWGSTIETRLKENEIRIEAIEKINNKIEFKLDDIQKISTSILIQLQNKKNRD